MAKVIQILTPPYLRLKQLAGRDGIGVITKWLADSPSARAKFRIRVEYLAQIPRTEWNTKQFRSLGGKLSEIKWEDDKAFRAIGFDKDGYFVMVIGCTHKQAVYDPGNCLATAATRMKEAKNGFWNIITYDLIPQKPTDRRTTRP